MGRRQPIFRSGPGDFGVSQWAGCRGDAGEAHAAACAADRRGCSSPGSCRAYLRAARRPTGIGVGGRIGMSSAALPPPMRRLRIVILGLSITSSWGNGHATTYRSLVRALVQRGHDVLFLERDTPWYRTNRDAVDLPPGSVHLYHSIDELRGRWRRALADADLVIIGSYVPEGIGVGALAQSIGSGIVAFYDIDTPVTLASLAKGNCPYVNPELVAGFDLYLSFTGGGALQVLERRYHARAARVLYCSVDPDRHTPTVTDPVWDMGYLGT